MFLSLREMELRKLCFEETFSPGEIQFLDGRLRQASPLYALGSAEQLPNTEGQIRVRGRLSVDMEADCDRCLETFSFPVEAEFDLFYEPAATVGPGDEVEIEEGELEAGFYEGDGLELEEILREQILLALPMQRLCRENCRGICPVCGQSRNLAACNCRVSQTDDRWAALRRL